MVYQFEMWFANEYIEEVVADFAAVLNLEYDRKDIDTAMEDLSNGIKNVLMIKREGCLLCIDCNAKDYIIPLVVICQDNEEDKIKAAMLEWDNKIRKVYGQKLREEVINVYYKNNRTLLRQIEEYYKISIHDEFLKYNL